MNLEEKLSLFSEHWSPKVVGSLDDYEIKLVKLQGDFVWHKHDDEDELFLALDGTMTIQLRDQDVELSPGEFFVVPKGVEHKPMAEKECSVMLFERKGVVNTGDVEDVKTIKVLDHI